MKTGKSTYGLLSGIDDGLNFDPLSKSSECEAGWTIQYCYDEDRNQEYENRADAAISLTGKAAAIAKVKFYDFVFSTKGNIKSSGDMAALKKFLTPYLGRIDACLISTNLGTGKKWNNRTLGDYGVAEVSCGLTDPNEAYTGLWGFPDRKVEDAKQHAYHVFKNVQPVVTFIKNFGDLAEARYTAPIDLRTNAERTEMVNKIKKGLVAITEIPGKVANIAPYVLGAAVLIWVLTKQKGE